jgi:inhibitor of KinA
LSKIEPVAEPLNSLTIFPLGDAAITLELGPCIDEHHNIRALAIHDWMQARRFPGILDIIVAYSSVSVFYDPAVVRASGVAGSQGVGSWVEELLWRGWVETGRPGASGGGAGSGGRHPFRIPVCYEGNFAPDLEAVAERQGLSAREVIELHCAGIYRVYMIGFLPGFPYLGTVDQRLEVPRKARPVPVTAGGVGIAGKQTGIYSLNSPGGWSIIGRTPVKLFEPEADPPVFLRTGDRVEFYAISSGEFRRLSGRPL